MKYYPKDLLQRELERRIALNPAYSLGAFAKSLNYDKAALSRILNGKRRVGAKTLARLSKHMRFDVEDSDATEQGPDFERLDDDIFASLHGYEHFAILELMQTKEFKSDVRWIAKSLAISTLKARAAVDRLIRLGIVKKSKTGKLIENGSGWTTSIDPDRTDEGRKLLQRELLQKAQMAIDSVPLAKRDHSSITFSMDDGQIAKAKTMIATFRRKLAKELSSDSKPQTKNSVYNLSLAFFPLTTPSTTE